MVAAPAPGRLRQAAPYLICICNVIVMLGELSELISALFFTLLVGPWALISAWGKPGFGGAIAVVVAVFFALALFWALHLVGTFAAFSPRRRAKRLLVITAAVEIVPRAAFGYWFYGLSQATVPDPNVASGLWLVFWNGVVVLLDACIVGLALKAHPSLDAPAAQA